MASPQRPEFHGIPENDRGLRPGRPPARQRAGFLFAWLIAVLLFAAFLYWVAFGWGGSGGYWWHHQETPVQSSAAHPVKGSGLAALEAEDKQPFIGKTFQVTNVPIQRKVSNRIFWIGRNSQSPMLVVFTGNGSSGNLKSLASGTTVDIRGTIEKAPATTDAASQWPLSEPELAQLEKEGAYVRATQMTWAPK